MFCYKGTILLNEQKDLEIWQKKGKSTDYRRLLVKLCYKQTIVCETAPLLEEKKIFFQNNQMTLLILNILYTVLTLNLFDSELQALKDRFNASSLEFHQLLTSLSSGQSEFDVRLLIMALIQESNYDLAKARGLKLQIKTFR